MLGPDDKSANGRNNAASGRRSSRQEVATALICENSLLQVGLIHLLSGSPFSVTHLRASEASSALGRSRAAPTLYIFAASTPSEQVFKVTRKIKEQHPGASVFLIAERFDAGFILSAIAAGIDGLCLTSTTRDILIKSLELVISGERYLSGELIQLILAQGLLPCDQPSAKPDAEHREPDPKLHELSPREKMVLRSIMGGDRNKAIAQKLDLTEATIKVHVKAILRKIGAANRTQAAMWGTENLTDFEPFAEDAIDVKRLH